MGNVSKAIGKRFDWMTKKQLDEFDVTQIPDDSDTGYILEVDLFYPPGIREENNDLPVAPESKAISEEELFNICGRRSNSKGTLKKS